MSAVNETDVSVEEDISSEDVLNVPDEVETSQEASDGDVISSNATPVKTAIKSDDTNIVKGNDFTVQLTDENSTPIADKSVQFTINSKVSNSTTDSNGMAKVKISENQGYYDVKYSFAADGYTGCENTTRIFVIPTSTSAISASAYTAYAGISNVYKVTLTVGGVPLASRAVIFNINGKTVTSMTDSKGRASININLAKGTYRLYYSYAGEDNINPVSGSVKVKVKQGAPVTIKKANSIIYRNKKADYLYVKLYDVQGNLLKSKKVIFKLNGKKYTKKTNSKGLAKIKIKLKTGTYKVKVYFKKTSVYNKATKSIKIKVKPKQARNNGMWLFAKDMKKVNFDTLQSYGFKQIFLNFKCLEYYGQSYVESWVKTANDHGIKVHLWMQVFYSAATGWQNPTKNGKIYYKLIKTKVKEAKKYAKIKGIDGVHFDYLRFPGNAYKYKNAVKAINYFTKKATKTVHKINKNIIVSAAVMPEPSSMKKYYGQNIPTMSKYLDVIVPMVYKGNYNAGSKWIKSVTKTFVKQSKKAKIWTGLQSYKSDSNWKKLSAKELMKDADAAALGGAYGVILFRYELFNYINFNEV